MKFNSLVAIALTTAAFSLAHAEERQIGPEEALAQLADTVAGTCDNIQEANCSEPFTATLIQGEALEKLPNLAAFKKIVKDESDIWPDTILEGDYASTNTHTILESVVEVKTSDEVALYYITFYEPAIYTASEGCEYNEQSHKYEGTCQAGRIIQRTYVGADLKTTYTYDDDAANFFDN